MSRGCCFQSGMCGPALLEEHWLTSPASTNRVVHLIWPCRVHGKIVLSPYLLFHTAVPPHDFSRKPMTDHAPDLESTHPNLQLTEIAYDAHHADFQRYPKFQSISEKQRLRWCRGLMAAEEARAAGQPYDVDGARARIREIFAPNRATARLKQDFFCWAPFFVSEAEGEKVQATNAGFAACAYFASQFNGSLGAGDDGIVLVRDEESGVVHRINVNVKLVARDAPPPTPEEAFEETYPASGPRPETSEQT